MGGVSSLRKGTVLDKRVVKRLRLDSASHPGSRGNGKLRAESEQQNLAGSVAGEELLGVFGISPFSLPNHLVFESATFRANAMDSFVT
jgi:hypothetical protein